MKKTRKIIALVLVAVMMMAMGGITVFAASINVQNAVNGETYTAYKILNYTTNGSDGYSYYLTSSEYTNIGEVLQTAGFVFQQGTDDNYYVTNASSLSAATAAASLNTNKTSLGNALGKYEEIGAGGTANFTSLDAGYYFITSTTGSLCSLKNDNETATLVEKNAIPSVDKKQSKTESDYTSDVIGCSIGDTVYYQIVVTDGTGTDKAITLTDTMSTGLSYVANSIKINGSSVADDANDPNWTVSVSGQTITIVLNANYVGDLDSGATVTVTYQATVNSSATINAVDGDLANKNTVTLQYSQQSQTDSVNVGTHSFTLKKSNGSSTLQNAQFKLYTVASGGTALYFTNSGTTYAYDPSNSGTDTIVAGEVTIQGLAPGDYYIEEIVPPTGYNALTSRQKVTISTGGELAEVINQAGPELPSTGGIGTTIFYVVGLIAVLGAGIFLVTNKRMAKEDI